MLENENAIVKEGHRMNRYSISTPEGTKDKLFLSCKNIREKEWKITTTLEGRGYVEVMTPTTEYYDVFMQAGMTLSQEKMLKCIDRNGRILVMRPDSTTPIARILATKIKKELLPLRLYYRQNVFRSDIGGHGYRSETMQVGAELLGVKGIIADLDILSSALESLSTCKQQEYRIELGHAGIYKALIAELGVDDVTAEEIRSLIESKNFAALNDMLEPYRSNDAYLALKAMPTLFGGAEVLEEVKEITDNEQVLDAVNYLTRIYKALENSGYGNGIMLDLGLVHEMDYYTGIMFRGYMLGAGSTVVSGGRYDSLCSKFGKDIPATGFAIDLDQMEQMDFQEGITKTEQLVFTDEASLGMALDYVKEHENATLSPFSSTEETITMAKNQGFKKITTIQNHKIMSKDV